MYALIQPVEETTAHDQCTIRTEFLCGQTGRTSIEFQNFVEMDMHVCERM